MIAKIQVFILSSFLSDFVSMATFDQSQSGNLNVQVDLKDLQIIALLKGAKEEYVDYDYAYDYSEMTIKPQNGTTPKPLNVTTITNSSTDAVTDAAMIPTTTAADITTLAFDNSTQELDITVGPTTEYIASNINATTMPPSLPLPVYNNTLPNAVNNSTGCKKGFVINQKGGCDFKLQGTSTNALLKLVKLSQKLKLRRERRKPQATQG